MESNEKKGNKLEDYEMPEKELSERRNEQIRMIEKKLSDARFEVYTTPKRGKTENRFYYKDGVDVVLCVIDNYDSCLIFKR